MEVRPPSTLAEDIHGMPGVEVEDEQEIRGHDHRVEGDVALVPRPRVRPISTRAPSWTEFEVSAT